MRDTLSVETEFLSCAQLLALPVAEYDFSAKGSYIYRKQLSLLRDYPRSKLIVESKARAYTLGWVEEAGGTKEFR